MSDANDAGLLLQTRKVWSYGQQLCLAYTLEIRVNSSPGLAKKNSHSYKWAHYAIKTKSWVLFGVLLNVSWAVGQNPPSCIPPPPTFMIQSKPEQFYIPQCAHLAFNNRENCPKHQTIPLNRVLKFPVLDCCNGFWICHVCTVIGLLCRQGDSSRVSKSLGCILKDAFVRRIPSLRLRLACPQSVGSSERGRGTQPSRSWSGGHMQRILCGPADSSMKCGPTRIFFIQDTGGWADNA